ncbi:MAG: hypothetical protein GC152_09270 [Alphaproteobacteria bacterium]|nr:hypothetical protein [Alphaproteobacteria bacterium]
MRKVRARSFMPLAAPAATCIAATGIAATGAAVSIVPANARDNGVYRVNGEVPSADVARTMTLNRLPHGDYYVRENGDFGLSGEAQFGNVNGGPPREGAALPLLPKDDGSRLYPDIVAKAAGARIFWVYSPSMFSGATGGSSGYVHLCPGGLALTSSEGAVGVGGEYDPRYEGGRSGSAGVAGTSAGAGRWAIEPGAQGPDLAVYGADGGSSRAPVATVSQGKWKGGQTTYAIEPGKASCGG